MKRFRLILLLVSSMVFTVSCGGGGGGGGDDPAPTPTPIPGGSNPGGSAELDGVWLLSCSFDIDFGNYVTGSLTLSNNTFQTATIEYSDSACATAVDSNTATGTFTIGNAITASGLSANEFDATFLTSNGSPISITIFDIYSITNGTLYFGDVSNIVNDGSTAAKRPIALDFNFAYTKS